MDLFASSASVANCPEIETRVSRCAFCMIAESGAELRAGVGRLGHHRRDPQHRRRVRRLGLLPHATPLAAAVRRAVPGERAGGRRPDLTPGGHCNTCETRRDVMAKSGGPFHRQWCKQPSASRGAQHRRFYLPQLLVRQSGVRVMF